MVKQDQPFIKPMLTGPDSMVFFYVPCDVTQDDRQFFCSGAYDLKGTKSLRIRNGDSTSKQMKTVMIGRILVAEFFLVHFYFLIGKEV